MKRTLLVLVVLLYPLSTKAISTGVPYGGLVTTVVPCTCNVVPSSLVILTPFFTGLPVPSLVGSLLYIPGVSVVYKYFQMVPGTFEVGSYTPTPAVCFVGAPPACTPLPAAGVIQYTGTSSLVPSPLF